MRAYTFAEAAVRCGVSPREIRLLVEEGRLRADRRAGVRVIEERELERAGLLEERTSPDDGALAPPLAVVLERLEKKAAELAAVRTQLEDAEARHAAEIKALRREVHQLREASRRGVRPSLSPLLGESWDREEPEDTDGR